MRTSNPNMPHFLIIYDSQTGYTEQMAHAIAEGAKSVPDTHVELLKIGSAFSLRRLKTADVIVFGSPVIYSKWTRTMESFLDSIYELVTSERLNISGKLGAAFGSFAFSGGWVIRSLGTQLSAIGFQEGAPSLAVMDGLGRQAPITLDPQIYHRCQSFGKTLVAKIAKK